MGYSDNYQVCVYLSMCVDMCVPCPVAPRAWKNNKFKSSIRENDALKRLRKSEMFEARTCITHRTAFIRQANGDNGEEWAGVQWWSTYLASQGCEVQSLALNENNTKHRGIRAQNTNCSVIAGSDTVYLTECRTSFCGWQHSKCVDT